MNWLEPWEDLTIGQRELFEKELRRELTKGHLIFGINAQAVGKDGGSDDILFRINNKEFEFALVHLTWSRESNPVFPRTTLYKDWDEFVQKKMKVDNNE